MATDRKIDPPHFDEHGRFIHPCCICGEEAGLGFGVSLLKGQLGTWYCGKCVSQRPGHDHGRVETPQGKITTGD